MYFHSSELAIVGVGLLLARVRDEAGLEVVKFGEFALEVPVPVHGRPGGASRTTAPWSVCA